MYIYLRLFHTSYKISLILLKSLHEKEMFPFNFHLHTDIGHQKTKKKKKKKK